MISRARWNWGLNSMADVSAVFFVFIAEQTFADCLIRRRISGSSQDKQVICPFQAVYSRFCRMAPRQEHLRRIPESVCFTVHCGPMTGSMRYMETCRLMSNTVEGTLQAADIAGHNVGVDFRGLDIRVAKQLLQNADIDPAFQHMCGETVA